MKNIIHQTSEEKLANSSKDGVNVLLGNSQKLDEINTNLKAFK